MEGVASYMINKTYILALRNHWMVWTIREH